MSSATNSKDTISVAVLLTCFNRKSTTLNCLEHLLANATPQHVRLRIYLVDDASTDGTLDAVENYYPQATTIKGDGTLFWGGGTYLAFAEAIKKKHDFYLWLNDDTILFPDAVTRLLSSHDSLLHKKRNKVILVGSTKEPDYDKLTFGGNRQRSQLFPLHFEKLTPTQELQACDTMNGNCVLIPSNVVDTVGLLDPDFRHYAGDFDYGLRAKRLACSIWVVPGYVGCCASSRTESEPLEALSLREVAKRLRSPKGLIVGNICVHPFSEWLKFTYRHGGLLWPLYLLSPYRKLALSLLSRKLGLLLSKLKRE